MKLMNIGKCKFIITDGDKKINVKEFLDNFEKDKLKAEEQARKYSEEKKIREDHQKYFDNENYWDQLRIAIALNVDGNIKELEAPDNNGDIEHAQYLFWYIQRW